MVNLIIHRSLLRGTPQPVLRHWRENEQRLVTDIPQRAVPEYTLTLATVAVCALSHRRP
jgi:hypothetical protein